MPARVALISTRAVLDFRGQRLARGAGPGTVNMDVDALSRMLRWGVKRGIIGSNPIEGIEPLPHDHPREGRALRHEEVDRLLEVSPQPWRDVWYALLVTGMRKSELVELTFSDIDWDARELIVRRGIAKNHNARRIPIEPGLWDILCRQEDGRKQRRPATARRAEIAARFQDRFTRNRVFVTTCNTPLDHGATLWCAFQRCCKRAGIPMRRVDAEGHEIDHVDIHSLRRTFATDLIENGQDPKTVQELLGHRTLAMTMGLYTKIRSSTKQQAVTRLSYGTAVKLPDTLPPIGYPAPTRRIHANGSGREI